MTLARENGRRTARIDYPVPLVAEALSALVTAAGYAVATDAHARIDLAIIDGAMLDAASGHTIGSAAPRMLAPSMLAPRMIVVVDASDAAAQRAALARGVAGIIATTASIDHFRACIAAVAGGGDWHDPEVADAVTGPSGPALTRRERDVAALVAAGQRNRAIAATLGISEGTVKMHLHNVYAKLGLESRTQLAMDARARG